MIVVLTRHVVVTTQRPFCAASGSASVWPITRYNGVVPAEPAHSGAAERTSPLGPEGTELASCAGVVESQSASRAVLLHRVIGDVDVLAPRGRPLAHS